MTETEREIASQPLAWSQAIELAAAPATVDMLPRTHERVAVLGCGTSWFVGQSFAALREATGHGETDAFTPSEMPNGRRYDRVVAISRSGTTTEVVRRLELLRSEGVPTTAITAVADGPVTEVATRSLVLGFADERSVIQTRFATSTLALLRASVGDDLTTALEDAERALAIAPSLELADVDHVVFLGHGWTVGLAHEAALKLREAAQVHTEAYPAMEYRHGPVSVAGPSSLVWVLATPDPTIATEIEATGATVRIGDLDPMAELILVHRVAVALATARGLDPDHPRHLTRSVVLS